MYILTDALDQRFFSPAFIDMKNAEDEQVLDDCFFSF